MIRNALRRFMQGRYGTDRLNGFLIAVYLVLLVVHMLTRRPLFYYLSFGLMVWVLFRTLSKNYAARSRENAAFLRWSTPILRWLRLQRTILRDKDHRYFKCPGCGRQLRVPRGKGNIQISCRGCGTKFNKKT